MFSHFTLGSNDLHRAGEFHAPVMETLGQSLVAESLPGDYLMFAPAEQRRPHLFVCRPFDGLPATWSNGYHIAFNAPDEETVDRFHAAALAHGGLDDGAPGLRPEYAPDYYGAYVRDPDGNKLQAVCYTSGRRAGRTGDIISHITIGHGDLERERAFYSAALAPLGITELPEEGDEVSAGFGLAGFELPVVYIQPPFDGRPATRGNGTHTAFAAPSREAVAKFHTAALAHGGTCDGPPGPRPHHSENYYAAYVLDQVGNKLQAVCREAG
ncbi:MAG: VOC family protein [Aestuariivirgaceae bacterium]